MKVLKEFFSFGPGPPSNRRHSAALGRLLLPLFLAGLGAVAWMSLRKIQFSTSIYELLPPDLVEVRGMDWLNRYFGRDGQLIVTVKSPDAFETEKTAKGLAERFRNTPELVSRVREDLSFDRLTREGGGLLGWLWLNAAPSEVKLLADRLQSPRSQETAADSMEMIVGGLLEEETMTRSYDPLGLLRLPETLRSGGAAGADAMVSDDGTFRIFYLEGKGVDFSNYREAAVWLDQIKALVQGWREEKSLSDAVQIGLTGTPAFMAEVGVEMEKDMTISVGATMLLISLLFWVMHRETQPLGWLISGLCLMLIATLSIGGLLFGKLSVMSAGFAAILLGLAADYGIVLYREAMLRENSSARELRAKVGPAIKWAAATTAVVFLSLNLSSLPGIAEMGNLVAIGIVLGAGIMLWGYSEISIRFAHRRKSAGAGRAAGWRKNFRFTMPFAVAVAVLIPLLAEVSILIKKMPRLEAEFHPFRIRSSPSMKAWSDLQSNLRGRDQSVPLIVRTDSMDLLWRELGRLEERLAESQKNGSVESFVLPAGIAPDPKHQRANSEFLRAVVDQRDRLLQELDDIGFSEDGSRLTRSVLESWEKAIGDLDGGAAFALPGGGHAKWTVRRLFYAGKSEFAALGSVKPTRAGEREWIERVCNEQSAVAGLASLGTALNRRIDRDLKMVFLPMIALLAIMLGLVFRSWKDWVLALFSLVFSGCVMVILTLWTPLSWNSFNICGLPLLFGTGLDFGVHMILALRRFDGELAPVHEGIGKALLFCGISSAIGFGSLSFASAHGLASLGQICAAGILTNMAVAVWLLPRWYRMLHGTGSSGSGN